MAKEMMMHEDWGMHKKMMGVKLIVVGALVLGNVYWPMVSWPAFIGWLLVFGGILKLLMPCCKKHKRR